MTPVKPGQLRSYELEIYFLLSAHQYSIGAECETMSYMNDNFDLRRGIFGTTSTAEICE